MIFDKRYIVTSAVKYNMLSQMLLLFSFITSCVSSKPVAFFHIICFPKKWLLFSRHMFHQNWLLFSRPQQLSHNESHYTLWLRFQFPSSISISISISVFKVDLNLDLDFSFASASISVSISVSPVDLNFSFQLRLYLKSTSSPVSGTSVFETYSELINKNNFLRVSLHFRKLPVENE